MDANKAKRIMQAIAECDAYINKEEKMSADLRPQRVVELLARYKEHRAKLLAMLAA